MLNRISKTILVLTICLGISIPTNAAVSVSDGSAFVTKAEFAADLNNLSNRMAQLENSLDAKIDSLVSSYLTRNGIWNGAKQDLENYYLVDFIGNGSPAQTSNIAKGYRGFMGKTQDYKYQLKSTITPPVASINSDFLEHTIDRKKIVIVNQLNKSGMLYMTVNVAPTALLWTGTADSRTWVGFYAAVTDDTTTVFGTTVKWNLQFGIEGGDPFGEVNAMQDVNVKATQSGQVYGFQLWGKLGFQQAKILTFVEKGAQVYLRDYFLFKRNTANGTMGNRAADTAAYGGIIVTVDDCAVY